MPPSSSSVLDEKVELTEKLIKYASGQFDASLVHTLQLPMLNIVSIQPAAFLSCSRLTSLDLSRNELKSLEGIQPLGSFLEVLNIAFNQIVTLEPLRKFSALQVLHAEGNKLATSESLQAIEAISVPTLRSVYFQARDFSNQNPICVERKSYLQYMNNNFPHVRCIDGHYFYKDEVNPVGYVDAGNDKEIQLPKVAKWIPSDYFGNVLMEPEKVGLIPEKAFHAQVAECKKALKAV